MMISKLFFWVNFSNIINTMISRLNSTKITNSLKMIQILLKINLSIVPPI